MMKHLITALALLAASPALAATGAFFSLRNTEFVVTLAFIAFIALLLYLRVPALLTRQLDARAAQISADLAEAKAVRDEARALLGSYEQKHKDVQDQSQRIIAAAREEAVAAANQAKAELKLSIARRLASAEDQIASAEASALRQVRERAIAVAVAAAGDILARQATPDSAAASIDAAIAQVGAKLH